ncbi:hypothetical protein BDF14DRAFT_1713389, partial [Spinellus fusiger]
MCVDYLSYKFDEMDLAASWRVMTKQKKDIINGIRLENASWRTWIKQKNKLKTISPETLNWLKDSDVTWLYGPLHTVIRNHDDRYAKPKVSCTQDTLGLIMTANTSPAPAPLFPPLHSTPKTRPLKSALKRVTMSDILKRSASEIHMDTLSTSKQSLSIAEANKQLEAFSPSVIATHRQPKLRFNQQVEQCIALNDKKDLNSRRNSEETDGGRLEINQSDEEENSTAHHRVRSIKMIAPARLKNSSHSEHETDVSSLSSASSSVPVSYGTL